MARRGDLGANRASPAQTAGRPPINPTGQTMPRHPTLRSATACLALAAATVAPGLASAGPVDHPILARASFVENVSFTFTTPCYAYGSIRGSGQAPSIGSFTLSSEDCINPIGTFNPVRPNSSSFAFGSTGAGLVLTTGSGDRIFASYSGNGTPQSNGLRLGGQFVVTGGTGPYLTATGGGIVFGQVDLSQVVVGQGEMTVLGVVRY